MQNLKNKTILLVGVQTQQDTLFEYTMIELTNLAKSCSYEVIGTVTQKLEHTKNVVYIGKGKLQEIATRVEEEMIEVVLFNDELSPSQFRNISDLLTCEVLDRTMVILEIFASRASTKEAQLQVEISQLQYQLPRLIGMNEELDRQGGSGEGVYNRGGGETKLELNRRRIENKITKKKSELKKMVQERKTQREKRKKANIKTVALVGYTNAGKSSLMNVFVDSEESKLVFAKDMLFATLETRVRKINLGKNNECLLTDTVGFVDKLPHHLIKAFRSTLEEVKEADLLIHVIDISNPHYHEQIKITLQTLESIGVKNIPIIDVYNKIDIAGIDGFDVEDKIYLSATQKIGIDKLKTKMIDYLFDDYSDREFLFPYAEGAVVSLLNEKFDVTSYKNEVDGIRIIARISKEFLKRYKKYLQ